MRTIVQETEEDRQCWSVKHKTIAMKYHQFPNKTTSIHQRTTLNALASHINFEMKIPNAEQRYFSFYEFMFIPGWIKLYVLTNF